MQCSELIQMYICNVHQTMRVVVTVQLWLFDIEYVYRVYRVYILILPPYKMFVVQCYEMIPDSGHDTEGMNVIPETQYSEGAKL